MLNKTRAKVCIFDQGKYPLGSKNQLVLKEFLWAFFVPQKLFSSNWCYESVTAIGNKCLW